MDCCRFLIIVYQISLSKTYLTVHKQGPYYFGNKNSSILYHSQHRFCKNRSTTTNLSECLNDWTLTLLSKEQHVVVYIDFSRAFDVLFYPKLFTRLHSYGVRGVLLSWLKNFFTGHMHQTKIDFAVSDIAVLLSGVVQGSGIGPTMKLLQKLTSMLT